MSKEQLEFVEPLIASNAQLAVSTIINLLQIEAAKAVVRLPSVWTSGRHILRDFLRPLPSTVVNTMDLAIDHAVLDVPVALPIDRP